jgi:hypothetical protein
MIGALTPRAVIDRHNAVVASGDLDAVVSDYTDDAELITSSGVVRGRDNIKEFFRRIAEELQDADVAITTVVEGERVIYLEWRAEAPGFVIRDGVDTFVVQGALIRAQTVRYTREVLEKRL